MQDMDISPGDSTPTSEVSYSNNGSTSQPQPQANEQTPLVVGPVLLANALPRLISHPIQHIAQTPRPTPTAEASPQEGPPTGSGSTPSSQTQVPQTSNAPGPPRLPDGVLCEVKAGLPRPVPLGENPVHTALTIDTNNHSGVLVEGPPTPTHSETPDCTKGKYKSLF